MATQERTADSPDVSMLEAASVRAMTKNSYKDVMKELVNWPEVRTRRLVSGAEIDTTIVRWISYTYDAGHRSWKDERLIAALPCLAPEVGRLGPRNAPRSSRALKWWKWPCPGHSRRPWA